MRLCPSDFWVGARKLRSEAGWLIGDETRLLAHFFSFAKFALSWDVRNFQKKFGQTSRTRALQFNQILFGQVINTKGHTRK